eukprot:2162656-Pleurochrysis_carterae.AAC.1
MVPPLKRNKQVVAAQCPSIFAVKKRASGRKHSLACQRTRAVCDMAAIGRKVAQLRGVLQICPPGRVESVGTHRV